MGSVLVPKGPRVEKQAGGAEGDGFDREALLAQLFALPVPPLPGHRTYPIDTPLGRIMRHKGLTIVDVCRLPVREIPNARVLTEVLAGRRELRAKEKYGIARGLGVDWRLL